MDTTTFNQEISRCLGCKAKPCEKACPVNVSPQAFIALAKKGNIAAAAEKIALKNPLPQTCGLICPDVFCQKACIRARIDSPIEIPCLQAQIMKQGGYPAIKLPPKINKKFAIVGSGPAGLGALSELLNAGAEVDLYEKASALGGAARLIPEHRLPHEVLDFEINRLIQNDRTKVYLNKEITDFESLKSQYDGIILALGEIMLRTLGVPGEEHSIPYTTYLHSPERYIGKKVAVLGGGNVALDCALTAQKNGSQQIEMFVRRRRQDMRIHPKEQLELEKFGIVVHDLSSVTNVNPENNKLNLTTIKNCINAEGKAQPISGTEQLLKGYDVLIQALGAYFPKEKLPEGFILAGDMTGQGGMVVQALASGRSAAKKLLSGEKK